MTKKTLQRGQNADNGWLLELFYHQLAGNLEVVATDGDLFVLNIKTTKPKPIPKVPIIKAMQNLKKPKGGK